MSVAILVGAKAPPYKRTRKKIMAWTRDQMAARAAQLRPETVLELDRGNFLLAYQGEDDLAVVAEGGETA